MFVDVKGKAVCLLCGDSVAVMKEYNVRGHFETKHHDRYEHLETKAPEGSRVEKGLYII